MTNYVKMCLIVVTILTSSGCSVLSAWQEQFVQYQKEQTFKHDVESSVIYAQEAQQLMAHGQFEGAKQRLDEAYQRYKDHVALHETYKRYYELTGDTRLAVLAQKRADELKTRSKALSKKGRIAMVNYDSYVLAQELLSLSLTYWHQNTDTLMNMATLAYVTNNVEMGLASIQQLDRIGYQSAQASMLKVFIFRMSGNSEKMSLALSKMSALYKGTPQYKLVHQMVSHG